MGTISVVMATFNGAQFIAAQLESLAAQSLQPYELIVSDDGSTDDTVQIVRRFQQQAAFPVVVNCNERRLGYGENFLQAARSARGEYIAFCDQDDVWHPSKLAIASEALEGAGAELFTHTARIVGRNGRQIGSLKQGISRDQVRTPLTLGPWGVLYGCSMVFRRQLLGLIDSSERGGHTFEYDGLLSHDLWIYFLATSLGVTVLDRRPLIDYRQHGGNVTPQVFGNRLGRWSSSLGLAADPSLRRGDVARHRADILAQLERSADNQTLVRRAAVAARYWRDVATFEDARTTLYVERSLLRRSLQVFQLVSAGAYRSFSKGALGGRLLVKDLLCGVFHLNSTRKKLSRRLALLRACHFTK